MTTVSECVQTMIVRWLGCVEYQAAWNLQKELADLRASGDIPDTLLLLEHPPTLTLGRGTDCRHLLAPEERLQELGISVLEVDRGGDITYHGPGQLVGYPILDLTDHAKDIHKFLRDIEQAIIDLLDELGLCGRRFKPHTGVWLGERKVAAIGVKVRRWVSTHGFALNVDPDMSHFELIVPCGIRDYAVTSLREAGLEEIEVTDLLYPTMTAFQKVFPSEHPARQSIGPNLTPTNRAIWDKGKSVEKSCPKVLDTPKA